MLAENTVFEGSQLIKTADKQGRGQILNMAGQVCGIMFKHESEKNIICCRWYSMVRCDTSDNRNPQPEMIVLNARGN